MNCKFIIAGEARIPCRSIVTGRNQALVKVFNTGRRMWGINAKGDLFTDGYADMKTSSWVREYPLEKLQTKDVDALAALGFLDKKTAKDMREKAIFDRFISREISSVESALSELADWGIKITKATRDKAEAYAKRTALLRFKRHQDRGGAV